MENKSSQIVTSVVDKDLDIKNHLIALNSYGDVIMVFILNKQYS